MPQKPVWYRRINEIIAELEALPRPYVDRATVEWLLGVQRRRAQQILAPLVAERVGSSSVVAREALIARLRRLAAGDEVSYEIRRQQRVQEILHELRRQRLERPHLLVEAPPAVLQQEFADLPAGVRISPGQILLEFHSPSEALEKLLALAMAIGNDFEKFEHLAQH